MKNGQELVKEVGLIREPGFMYWIGKDGNIWSCPLATKKRKWTEEEKQKNRKLVFETKIKREKTHLYFIGGDGNIWATQNKRGISKK